MPQAIAAVGVIVTSFVGAAISTTLGVALATAGAFVVGAATIVAAGMLANKIISNLYEMPTMDTDASRQSTVKSTVEPQKIIYGETLVSGPISFVGVSGPKNRDLYHAVVLAGHEVNAITDIHFDNEVIFNSQIDGSGNVTSGRFEPIGGDTICKINKKLGGAGQAADADLVATFNAYTSNHKGTGLAYIVTKWTLTDKSQETWDKYKPQNIKALVQGRKVYDYRLDDELVKPNVNDPDFIAYSTNPVWCLIDYLINTNFGMSVNPNRIDWDAAEAAADACDVLVDVPGGTEKRFTCNGVLFGTDTHKTNINKLLSSMNGMLSYTNGQFVIRAGAYEAPSVSLDEDSLSGAVSVKTSVERSDRFNTVNGVFIDPSQNYKSTEFPEVFTTAARSRDNDEILTKEIQLPMTNSRFMAQRIANKLVQQSDQQKVVTFPTNLSGMEVAVGDRVSVSLDEFNWSNKVFLCLGWTLSDSGNGGVNLILREDDSGSYADPAVGEYSTISATGALVEGFRGVPDPSNLSATAGLKSIELNWTNPDNMSDVLFVEVFASPDSSWANRVKIGEVNGTQFFHDGSTTADPLDIGDERYYWVRARAYSTGEDATAVSDRNPDNDTSTINATVGGVNYDDVVGDGKPEDNATVGATIGTDLFNVDGSTVLNAVDVLNQVLEDQILNIQIESGEVLDLETGQDVAIQNLGDVAIYVNESNQLLNTSIGSLSNAFSNLENTLVDLTSGVSDVYVQATPPVAGVGSIPDPIPTFSRWYDSDDSNEPYYWDGTEWVSLADPRIASNASSITTLQSGLNTANSNISANSTAIDVLDTTTISQGNSISSLSSDVTTLQSELNTAEGDIITNANAVSGLTTRVTTAEDEITSQASDITALETTVNDPTTGVTASATAISGLDTRVTANEDSITSQASQTTVLNASLSDLVYIQDESDSILETEAGDELLLNLATNVATATSEIVQTLDSRVVATEEGVASQSQAITALQSELGTVDGEQQATAGAVTALTTRVTQTENDISINASDITSLESNLSTADGNITANASAISSLDTRVTSAEGSITVNSSDITALESSLTTTDGNVSANASAISSLDTRVTSAEGSITAQSSDITSLQSSLSSLDGTVSGNSSAISSLTTRVTDNEGDITSTASSLTALSSTVTDPTTGLAATASVAQGANTLAQTLDGEVTSLQAEAYLTVSAGGNVAGFKATADSASSDFTIQADRFALVSTNEGQTTVPFVVNGTTGLVGFTANVVIDGDLITNGTISTDKIAANTITASEIAAGTITATEIATDAITADKINVSDLSAISATLGTVTAGTFKTAESGFRVEISDTGDFPIWYGTGTKTAENGLFYVDNAGDVFINAIVVAQVGSTIAVLKVSVDPIFALGFSSTITTDPAVVTITNGTGPYNYAWTRQATNRGPTPTISSSTAASPTFTVTGMDVNESSNSVWEVVVTDTATSDTATAQVYVNIFRETDQ